MFVITCADCDDKEVGVGVVEDSGGEGVTVDDRGEIGIGEKV